jgi:hypothetical protein
MAMTMIMITVKSSCIDVGWLREGGVKGCLRLA